MLVGFALGSGVAVALAAVGAWWFQSRLIAARTAARSSLARAEQAERAAASEARMLTHADAERESLRAELAAQRLFDPATGLPTRTLFADRLAHALILSARRTETLGVFMVDPCLPGTLSTDADARGRLSIEVGQRIQVALRRGDSIAEAGDGRFLVLLEALHDVLDAVAVAERVIDRFLAPVALGDAQVMLSPRIGIALGGGHERPDDLVAQAEAALATVRHGTMAALAVYDPSMAAAAVERVELEAELGRALANGEIRLLYEPIVRLADGRVAGYEARPVWEHPRRGPVESSALIAIADAVGMTFPLQQWTLAEVCRQLGARRQTAPEEETAIGIDIAPRPYQHPALVGDVARALHGAGANPRHLRLEIDQAQVLEDIAATVARLEELNGIGVTVAIDGFGTGYAALGFLQRIPVASLKIDSGFVAGLGTDADDTAIVQAALAFACGLEIPVVAVGVETAAQRDELRRLGCDFGQGGVFSPPVPADEIEAGGSPVVEAGAAQHGGDPRAAPGAVTSSGND